MSSTLPALPALPAAPPPPPPPPPLPPPPSHFALVALEDVSGARHCGWELQLFGERAHTILLTADQLKTAHTEGERLLDERTRVGKAA